MSTAWDQAGEPPLDFVVIGAYKAATTSLHLTMAGHPDIFVPDRKEPSYYAFEGLSAEEIARNPISRTAVTDPVKYRALFRRAPADALVGEVSPEYLKNERCAAILSRHHPGARLIAILRHPVDRAFSDYLMYRRDGVEPCSSFADALAQQDARRERRERTGHYIDTGMYGAQLRRYYEEFPDEQILVLLQEQLAQDRHAVLERLAGFLGIDAAGFDKVPIEANRSGIPTGVVSRALYTARRQFRGLGRVLPNGLVRRLDSMSQRTLTRPELDPAVRARLLETFGADIDETERLTGLDLGSWKR